MIAFDRKGYNVKEAASGKGHIVGLSGKPLCGRPIKGRFVSATSVPLASICKDCIAHATAMLPPVFTPPEARGPRRC